MSRQIGIAFAINIPWAETNERRAFELEILTEDGETLQKIGGNLEVGRAAGIQPGTEQRVQMAANANLEFKGPGNFVVVARVDDHETHGRSHQDEKPRMSCRVSTAFGYQQTGTFRALGVGPHRYLNPKHASRYCDRVVPWSVLPSTRVLLLSGHSSLVFGTGNLVIHSLNPQSYCLCQSR